MGYSHILVALDLSEESNQVLDKATGIASLTGAQVSLVSIIRPLTQVYGGLDLAPLAAGSVSFEQEALQQATTQIRSLGQQHGIPAERTHVFIGSPAHDIRKLAERIHADLIVVGSHGRHGLGLLLGSTASSIMHGVTCDVLAVRMQFDS
jgi:universal stress protein A